MNKKHYKCNCKRQLELSNMINNTSVPKLELELEQLEKDSQNRLDDKIMAVCSTMLGLSVGFISNIRPIIQEHLLSQILFVFIIICLSITTGFSVYGHYYSSQSFRKFNEQKHYAKYPNFKIDKAIKCIQWHNRIQTYAFINTIISIALILIFLIFATSYSQYNQQHFNINIF